MNHLGMTLLETDRLLARPFIVEDIPNAFKNWTSDEQVTRYLTWPTHRSEADTQAFLDYCIANSDNPDFYQWGIVLKETGELIGNIAVVGIKEKTLTAELGWVIGRQWWGKLICQRLQKQLLTTLSEKLDLTVLLQGMTV